MDREQLRTSLLAGADKLHNSMAWRFLNHDEKRLSLAGRQFWSEDNPTTNAALDALLIILNSAHQAP